MKYIVVLGDGMADEPVNSLGDMTPLRSEERRVGKECRL